MEFLNAVDAEGTNPHDVYNPWMGSPFSRLRGGINFDAEAAHGGKYSVKTNFGNKPVNFVSFFDSMRFVNWLENGQPHDGSGTESTSFHGTFDQAGNVWEWNESVTGTSFQVLRGGEWFTDAGFSASWFRRIEVPTFEYHGEGFRVASIPEPGPLLLGACGALALLPRRRPPGPSADRHEACRNRADRSRRRYENGRG